MLRRSNRLSARQFNEIMRSGKALHSAFFLARVASATDDVLRIAAVAPVKVAKKAVIRNRIRRRIYGAIRAIGATERLKPAHIAILAKSGTAERSSKEMSVELEAIFVKAGLLR